MKKQINPTIKAHLIRGAFYLLLLVAVCAIPFALAQRNTIKRGQPGEQVKDGYEIRRCARLRAEPLRRQSSLAFTLKPLRIKALHGWIAASRL